MSFYRLFHCFHSGEGHKLRSCLYYVATVFKNLWTLSDDGLNYLESDRFLNDLKHVWFKKHVDYVEILVRNLPLYPNIREELEYYIKTTAYGLNKFSSDFPKYKLVLVAHEKLKLIPKATSIIRFDFPRFLLSN